ncbi:DUF6316 family protein [Microbulbifer harenosus]|uniref:DUF6316 domain-containing protein n=1 Tax=Microbulbifer harenosus TaxID=2576840 RepID=A0ABY2ULJ0_9GAMM|nr:MULTISPECIES: DUF6316 family protein [Microbulbifer]QIL90962.1 hypothetical protein GNX18_15150 [Microbulbifer sp. SH-1]TLM79185.1 hypothetical protein FDY93_03505 [Microbulbifer harenosus]
MQQYRRGEQGAPIPPRADRFFKVDDDWYFTVRGGKTFGPFCCREEAEKAVDNYLNPRQKYSGNVRPFGSQRARHWYRTQKF